jgi:hypothetical protein
MYAENLALTGIRSPDRQAHSESLYRVSCTGHFTCWGSKQIHFRKRYVLFGIHGHFYMYLYLNSSEVVSLIRFVLPGEATQCISTSKSQFVEPSYWLPEGLSPQHQSAPLYKIQSQFNPTSALTSPFKILFNTVQGFPDGCFKWQFYKKFSH